MNSDSLNALIPIFAVILTFLVPITALIGWIITDVNRKTREKELKESVVLNKTDAEVVKLLFSKPKGQKNSFILLRSACIFLGLGLGAIVNFLLSIKDPTFFCLTLAAGVGVGLLVAFIVEIKMNEKRKLLSEDEKEN